MVTTLSIRKLSGTFTFRINRAGERVMGYTREKPADDIADVIRPEGCAARAPEDCQNLAGEGAPDFELEIFAKS